MLKQGILMDPLPLSCPAPTTSGQSINYLIEAQYQENDVNAVVLPYYNASNPAEAWSGPSNTGSAQNTSRRGVCNVIVKAGTAAPTGTQLTPSADVGFVGLYVVTVGYGQTGITAANIVQASGAPFLNYTLPGLTTSTGRVVTNMAAVRAIPATNNPNVFSMGANSALDGGGGAYQANYSDTTSGWFGQGSISGNTLTLVSTTNGSPAIGQLVSDAIGLIAPNTYITGGSGTSWTVNNAQTVTSRVMVSDSGGPFLVGFDGVRRFLPPSTVITAEHFGATGLGVTDDSPAFFMAQGYWSYLARTDLTGISGNQLSGFELVLTRKGYLIKSAGALLGSGATSSSLTGLSFRAAGAPGKVQIIYNPTVVGAGALINNNNEALFVRFKGITFVGKDNTSPLMASYSSGQAQDIAFQDCIFSGSWQYGIVLTGTNNNSEFKFETCAYTGSWGAFLFSAATGTSDQFLNYWHSHCKYLSSSPWIDMSAGGGVRFSDCDISGYSPAALPAGQGPNGGNQTTYLFNFRGNNHSLGVCAFSWFGGRIEQKTQYAGVLYSEWNQGDIVFVGVDMGSQAYQSFSTSLQSIVINVGNTQGALLTHTNCEIMGVHIWNTGVFGSGAPRVTYRDCTFLSFNYPDQAFSFSSSSGQVGRFPTVRLENCRGNLLTGVYSDADLNGLESAVGFCRRKLISLRDFFGGMPDAAEGTVSCVLPLNCAITRVTIFVPAGSSSSATGCSYTVETSETTPTVLAALTFPGSLSAGGSVDVLVNFQANTRQRATVNLVPSSGINQAIGGYVLVEYV